MKQLLILLLISAVGYAVYSSYSSRSKEAQLLESEVEKLKRQNDELAKKSQLSSIEVQVGMNEESVRAKRLKDLQAKLVAEMAKLQDFQKRKDAIQLAINDPAKSSSIGEFQNEIREKNEAIQSLELQLSANQNDEKMVDHGGEQAKQYQNVSRTQAIADINARIRTQEALIQSTQTSIQSFRYVGTAEGDAQTRSLRAVLAQQKADLITLKAGLDQVNVTNAVQTSQIHEQVGYEKSAIHATEQEIRSQIMTLKNEIKVIESHSKETAGSTTQLKQQATYLDQQIASEKTEIDRIKGLIQAL